MFISSLLWRKQSDYAPTPLAMQYWHASCAILGSSWCLPCFEKYSHALSFKCSLHAHGCPSLLSVPLPNSASAYTQWLSLSFCPLAPLVKKKKAIVFSFPSLSVAPLFRHLFITKLVLCHFLTSPSSLVPSRTLSLQTPTQRIALRYLSYNHHRSICASSLPLSSPRTRASLYLG